MGGEGMSYQGWGGLGWRGVGFIYRSAVSMSLIVLMVSMMASSKSD